MKEAILIINLLVSIVIVALILLQNKGSGLGGAWGGGGEMFQARRGVEKIVMHATIFCIVIFFIISFANLFIS